MRLLENKEIYAMTESEIQEKLVLYKAQFKKVKKNFEFDYALMLRDDIKVLQDELIKRTEK